MSSLPGLTLDAGALIALERGTARIKAVLRRALEREATITVPSVVIAQAWRGGHRRWIDELRPGVVIEPVDEAYALAAGELLARTGTKDAIDAIVAVGAARRGDVVVTSDPQDLLRLVDDASGVRVVGV